MLSCTGNNYLLHMHKILMLIIVIPKVLLYYLGSAICLFNCEANIQKQKAKK